VLGGTQALSAPDSCQHRWEQASRTRNQCGGSRLASERFRQPYAVTGSSFAITVHSVETRSSKHALL
jgi:hypothetical protein